MPRCSPLPLITLLLVLPTGCQTPLPEPTLNVVVDPVDAQRLGFNYTWSRGLALAEGQRLGHATVLDDLVFVVEEPNNLMTALSMKDGRVAWMKPWLRPHDRLFPPVRNGDKILINSETDLYVIEADTGRVLAIQPLASPVRHAPVMVGDYAVFGGFDGRLFAHDHVAGFTAWAHLFDAPITAQPTFTGHGIFAADAGGQYALLDVDGHLLRSGRTFDRVSAPPVATGIGIFVASEDHTLYALNRMTLQDRWKFRANHSLTLPPVQLGNVLYLRVPGAGTIALDATDGREMWKLENLDAVAVHSEAGAVLMFTGDELWKINIGRGHVLRRVPAASLHSVLSGKNGALLLVSQSGRMMRLDRI